MTAERLKPARISGKNHEFCRCAGTPLRLARAFRRSLVRVWSESGSRTRCGVTRSIAKQFTERRRGDRSFHYIGRPLAPRMVYSLADATKLEVNVAFRKQNNF